MRAVRATLSGRWRPEGRGCGDPWCFDGRVTAPAERGLRPAAAAAHKICMTLLDLTDTSLAFLEATLPEQPVFWTAFSGEGETDWIGARQLVEKVGWIDAFAYLVLRGVADGTPLHRFAQTCGRAGEGLLVEIAIGDTVGVVAERGVGFGNTVVVTPERPWSLTTCDERVLTDVGTVMDVAHKWITAGRLDTSRYELRPVGGFELPRLGS